MLSHLKSRNGYGIPDINQKEDEVGKKEIPESTSEAENGSAATVTTADESSEAAESSVNSEIEDIEIHAEGEPEPGTDGSTYSEEESEDDKDIGEKRKRGERDSEEDDASEGLRSVRKAKRTSKGRGWGWLLDEEKEESDSDYTPEVDEVEEEEDADQMSRDPDFGKKPGQGGRRGRGGRTARPPKSDTIEQMLEEMESGPKVRLAGTRRSGRSAGLRGLRGREDMDSELGKSDTIELMKREIDTSVGMDRAATGYISKKTPKKNKPEPEMPVEAEIGSSEPQESEVTENSQLSRLPIVKDDQGEKDPFGFDELEDTPSKPPKNSTDPDCLSRGPCAVSTSVKHDIRNGAEVSRDSPARERPRGVGLYLASQREEKKKQERQQKEAWTARPHPAAPGARGRGRGRGRGRPPGRVKVEVENSSKTKSLFNASQRAKRLKNLLQYADADEELNRLDIKSEIKEEKREDAEQEESEIAPYRKPESPEKAVASPAKVYQVTVPVKIDVVAELTEAAVGALHEMDCFYCSKVFRSPSQSATEKCYQTHLKEVHHVVKEENNELETTTTTNAATASEIIDAPGVYSNVNNILNNTLGCDNCDACFKTQADLERHVFKEHYGTFCEKYL